MYGTEKSEIMCTQVRSFSLYFYHIMNGDNVKIYMHMMDLEYSEKVFFFSKKMNSPRCKLLRNCI